MRPVHHFLLSRLPMQIAFAPTWIYLEESPLAASPQDFFTYGKLRFNRQVSLKVNPYCLGARYFTTSGFWEPDITQSLLSRSHSGLLIDIGANYGYFSVLWLQQKDNRVIAVEPVSEYVNLLQENLATYKERSKIVSACIGDGDKRVYLDTMGDPQMLSKVIDVPSSDSREVPMLSLESLLAKYNEHHIDVLKIDAEGYDIKILESCKSLFSARRVTTVYWETASSPEEDIVIQNLEKNGYVRILSGDMTGYELDHKREFTD